MIPCGVVEQICLFCWIVLLGHQGSTLLVGFLYDYFSYNLYSNTVLTSLTSASCSANFERRRNKELFFNTFNPQSPIRIREYFLHRNRNLQVQLEVTNNGLPPN